MSKYAIIKIGPFQYKVEEGKEYSVPRFDAEEGKKFTDHEVLALANEDKINFGKPALDNSLVAITVIEQAKGEKVTKRVYRAKSRYEKNVGHRKLVTKFKVDKINLK